MLIKQRCGQDIIIWYSIGQKRWNNRKKKSRNDQQKMMKEKDLKPSDEMMKKNLIKIN